MTTMRTCTTVEDPGPSRAAFARLPEGLVHLVGRSRENKLVHVAGAPVLYGELVQVRVDHAGAYALRGTLVTVIGD